MITNMIWQSDVDLVINKLSADKHNLKDLDHFYQTVNNVEDMRSPDGKHTLTLRALEAWENRCMTGATQDERSTDTAAKEDDQDRPFQDTRTILHPRRMDQVHADD